MSVIIYHIAAIVSLIALFLTFLRLILGPDLPNRTVALDAMTIITISVIGFIGFLTKRVIYLDVAIVYGLISFIGIVALARYLERGI